jgi:uridine kinase
VSPVVIGIAGGTASGKTTLAAALCDALGPRAALLTHDRYYRSLPPGTAPSDWNFDHPDALETELMTQHVDAWRQRGAVMVPTYDFAGHCRNPDGEGLPVCEVLLIEGILVMSDAGLRDRMDHKLFVHTPDDIRLARRIRRDIVERGRSVDTVLDQYLATVRPMHESFVVPSVAHADLVLSGLRPIADLVAEARVHLGL